MEENDKKPESKKPSFEIISKTGRPVGPSNSITTALRLQQWRRQDLARHGVTDPALLGLLEK